MTLRLSIFALSAGLVLGAAAQQPAPPRTQLFSGNDTGGLLPPNKLLPTAAEVEAQAQKLGVRLRNQDPFGLAMFPREDSQPVVEEDGLRLTPRITLNQALQTLKVNGVNLKRKEFLLGGRNAFEGDVLQLMFKGELFQAQVVEVGPTQILFRDLDRQETGILSHTVMPQLDIEPIRNVTPPLQGRVTPMEAANPKKP